MAIVDKSELDYYIKYPDPDFDYNQKDTDGCDFSFVAHEKKIPVVILFGWAGCQDKHLVKYSEIYEKKGLITLRYTAPVEVLLLGKYKLMFRVGEKFVKLLIHLKLDSHPIIVHCFSNNGAFLYQTVSLAMEKYPKKFSIKGVIFDSAPGQRRVWSIYQAVSAFVGGNAVYNFLLSFPIATYLCLLWFYELACHTIWPETSFVLNPMEHLKDETNTWPQLFMYSKKDELIVSVDIEYFADYRKKLGVDVTTVCYESSLHVKHYAENPEDYMQNVYNFVRRSLIECRDNHSSRL